MLIMYFFLMNFKCIYCFTKPDICSTIYPCNSESWIVLDFKFLSKLCLVLVKGNSCRWLKTLRTITGMPACCRNLYGCNIAGNIGYYDIEIIENLLTLTQADHNKTFPNKMHQNVIWERSTVLKHLKSPVSFRDSGY